MIERFFVNFDQTFPEAVLLAIEPKMTRSDKSNPKSEMVQAKDKDGALKWTILLSVATKSFENTDYVTIHVTVTSPTKPYGAIPPRSLVTAEGFTVGIMPQTRSNGSTGFSIFYSAESIRQLHPAHPTQPARAASGQ